MVLIQEASFKKPRGKNWQKKYVQLDFTTSIKDLKEQLKELTDQQERSNIKIKDCQKFILTAFMEKCMCLDCKLGWKAYEKAVKGVK